MPDQFSPPSLEPWLHRSLRRYRILLRAWPSDFREQYGADMTETFARHLLREKQARGRLGVALVWVAALADALRGGGRERIGVLFGGHPGTWMRDLFLGGDLVGEFLADVKYALRSLVRRPVLAVTSIVTLALGIGANAAIFSVVNGLLLRPLPYDAPEELVSLFAQNHERGWNGMDMNMADAWDMGARAGVFQSLTVFNGASYNLTGGDQPEVVQGVRSTTNLFTVFGRMPAQGRAFIEADGREGAAAVAIISDGFWDRRFAREPDVLGKMILLDGEPTEIVGVMPADFLFMDDRPEVWTALRLDPSAAARGGHSWDVVARLKPGLEEADADRAVIDVATLLQAEYPDTNEGFTVDAVPLKRELIGDIALQASVLLMVVVGFVLLMACVNVANLLLARADSRKAELSVRVALGAGKGRILRQLMTESLVLAAFGGLAGALLAVWGNAVIIAGLPDDMPPVFNFSLDGTVLAFTAGVSVLSAGLFGLAPAWSAARGGALELRSGQRGSQGRRSKRFGASLVVVQTALAVMLLVGGGIMVRSVTGMATQDFGWEPEGLLTAVLTPSTSKYEEAEAFGPFHDQVLERLGAVPGVVEVGSIHTLPLGGSNWSGTFSIPERADDEDFASRTDYISPGYFATMDLTVLRGRDVLASDLSDAPGITLVNETFVRRFFPNEDPLGKVLLWGATRETQIVGVVEDHLERGIDRAVEPAAYVPLAQVPIRRRHIVIRTAGDPLGLAESVRQAVWDIDPEQPVDRLMSMHTLVDRRVGGFRLIAQLMGAFALVSLVLGAVGIYGVTAFAVGQRAKEIGVRMAMGADAASVRKMVLNQGLRRAALGLFIGLGLAFGMGQAMSGLLVGVSPRDPLTFVSVFLTILTVAVVGSYLPARKASAADPVRALSAE